MNFLTKENFLPLVQEQEAKKHILTIIASVHQIAGFRTATPEDYAFDAKELMQELRRPRYRDLSQEEIAFAFREGALERYGEYMGANMRTYIKWLDMYIISDDKKEYEAKKKEYISSAKQIEEKIYLSKSEQEQIVINGINKEYQDFLDKKLGKNISSDLLRSSVAYFMPAMPKAIQVIYQNFLYQKGMINENTNLLTYFEECYKQGKETIL